jgi:hypothetical protein
MAAAVVVAVVLKGAVEPRAAAGVASSEVRSEVIVDYAAPRQ